MTYELTWADLVSILVTAKDTVFNAALRLLTLFVTPFEDIIDTDLAAAEWVLSILEWVLGLFGVSFMSLTPLEFMLGSTIPIIIVFTIYRYVKQ